MKWGCLQNELANAAMWALLFVMWVACLLDSQAFPYITNVPTVIQ